MTKIPTAEEQADKFVSTFPRYGVFLPNTAKKEIAKLIKQFTKFHVQACKRELISNIGLVKTTSKKLNSEEYKPFITDEDGQLWTIDIEKILKAYPLENIK